MDAPNCKQHESCFVFQQTTGLVGLAVCETPHERLRILYTKTLDVLEQIPKTAAYRKYTEQITNEKLDMVKAVSS